jgi:uncharacterized protein
MNMKFAADDARCRRILERDRVIAVVGLSTRPSRPSYGVAAYMQAHGYRIVPVNPAYAGQAGGILGETCYASLADAAHALAAQGSALGMVNVFRRSQEVAALIDAVLDCGARSLWLQLGVIDMQAAERAAAAGLDVVMDRCVKIDHARLMPGMAPAR